VQEFYESAIGGKIDQQMVFDSAAHLKLTAEAALARDCNRFPTTIDDQGELTPNGLYIDDGGLDAFVREHEARAKQLAQEAWRQSEVNIMEQASRQPPKPKTKKPTGQTSGAACGGNATRAKMNK